MATITAQLNNYRQSPRKVRLVADLIKGKKVPEALLLLDFTVKAATLPLKKLLKSALANAKNKDGLNPESLVVSRLEVNSGVVLKRSMPRARGSAFPIKKRTSHIKLVLEEQASEKLKVESSKAKKEATKKKE